MNPNRSSDSSDHHLKVPEKSVVQTGCAGFVSDPHSLDDRLDIFTDDSFSLLGTHDEERRDAWNLPGILPQWKAKLAGVLFTFLIGFCLVQPLAAGTPVGTTIENGIDPGNQFPSSPGELSVRYANQAGDTSFVSADTTASFVVDFESGVRLTPSSGSLTIDAGESDTFAFKLTNLANGSDSFTVDRTFVGSTSWDTDVLLDIDGDSVIDGGEPSIRLVPEVSSDGDTYFVAEIDVPSGATSSDTFRIEALSSRGSDTDVLLLSISVNASGTTTIDIEQSTYEGLKNSSGDPLRAVVTVQDSGANTDPGTAESLTVTVRSDIDDDGITVELDETGSNTGEFSGYFRFTQGFSEARKIAVDPNSTVEASYVVSASTTLNDTTVWIPNQGALTTVDKVRTWPNPYKPLSGEPFVFQNLPADRSMEIMLYNVQGQLVRRLTVNRGIEFHSTGNIARWFGRNDLGSRVASGVYIYVVKSKYGVKKGKMTLVK